MGSENTKSLKRLFTGSLIALAAVTACCAERHPPEAYEALASLRKVQAATQVGVNYQQYGQLLIKAKDKTNAASRVLSDGPLKAELQAAMDAYSDATQVWGAKIKSKLLNTSQEPGSTLTSKYSLKTFDNAGIESVDADEAMRTIWLNADLHLTKLANLLPENRK
jgi:hypothetical protein